MNRPLKTYPNILVISEDGATLGAVMQAAAACGVRCAIERPAKAAAARLEEDSWQLAVIDCPSSSLAMELLGVSKSQYPERPVIVIGSGSDIQLAVQATKMGCGDVLARPITQQAAEAWLRGLALSQSAELTAVGEEDSRCLFQIAGKSPVFLAAIDLARRVAPTSLPVLITGESGTGKELISHFIHHASKRRSGPYIRVNCAALNESLLESELFGHERGAFTGAVAQHKGRFERAHGGTLLLDEISETSPRLQAELLRVLEQQDIERVGGQETLRVNVRVICTSNRDLASEVEQGRFRRDLYYRIRGVQVVAPPLRQRPEDIRVLVWHFVNQFSQESGRTISRLDEGMMDALEGYTWPGNVRQLRNMIRSAMILGHGPVLSLEASAFLMDELVSQSDAWRQISAVRQGSLKSATPPGICGAGVSPAAGPSSTLSLQELERRAILEALQRSQRNQVKAARLLGITDRTLREKLRRYRAEGRLEAEKLVGEAIW